MKTKIVSIMGVCLCAMSFCPKPAEATLITIAIEAVVDDVQDPDNYLEGRINIGDLITGIYTYDTDTPDSSSSANVGRYEHYSYPCGFSLSVGSLSFMTDPGNTNFVVEIGNNAYYDDFYIVDSLINLPLPDETSVSRIRFVLGDPSETAISSIELPVTAPILTDWAVNYLNVGGGRSGFAFLGHVTSAVVIPEPGTILLMAFGAICLVRKVRR